MNRVIFDSERVRLENETCPCGGNSQRASISGESAFTLLEVMIAAGILFICLFSVLTLLATSLRNARMLQNRPPVDAGILAAELSLTNKLTEGKESGDFRSYGDAYADFRWNREIFLAETNGLFAVDFVVFRRGNERSPESHMTILLFAPESTVTPGKFR